MLPKVLSSESIFCIAWSAFLQEPRACTIFPDGPVDLGVVGGESIHDFFRDILLSQVGLHDEVPGLHWQLQPMNARIA